MKRFSLGLLIFFLPSCSFFGKGKNEIILQPEKEECKIKQEDLDTNIVIQDDEFVQNLESLFVTHGVLLNSVIFNSLNNESQEVIEAEKASLSDNAHQIANVLASVYGSRIGNRFEYLFKRHVQLGLAYIQAVRENDQFLASQITLQAYHNSDMLIEFLNIVNPYLPLVPEKFMFEEHIRLESEQAIAYFSGDYQSAENIKEEYFKQLEEMARQWAKAILTQFYSRCEVVDY